MWKYCNKDVIDADYECLEKVIGTMTKDSCPELENAGKLDLKTLGSLTTSCLKNQYINNGCDKEQWVRVCNRRADRFNVAANGGQEVIDMWRSTCDENAAYNCFENAIKDINDESCAEVVYSKSQNDTAE
uniref:DUF19 domain-containing protein n=1 Tax=Panagrolaimus davidi TaxID=227884 RepID=A0A914QBW7_9BILA